MPRRWYKIDVFDEQVVREPWNERMLANFRHWSRNDPKIGMSSTNRKLASFQTKEGVNIKFHILHFEPHEAQNMKYFSTRNGSEKSKMKILLLQSKSLSQRPKRSIPNIILGIWKYSRSRFPSPFGIKIGSSDSSKKFRRQNQIQRHQNQNNRYPTRYLSLQTIRGPNFQGPFEQKYIWKTEDWSFTFAIEFTSFLDPNNRYQTRYLSFQNNAGS